tara:strand:- start:11607 stop:11798 length:192 start_codon:yes stop_codon:yes gene_type:complete
MKAEEITDMFYTMESDNILKILKEIKNDADSSATNILNKESNTCYQDFVDLILYNIDVSTYVK